MKTVVINYLSCSEPKTSFFGRKVTQDYDTPLGVVRETSFPKRLRVSKYRLLSTKEIIKVEFARTESDL